MIKLKEFRIYSIKQVESNKIIFLKQFKICNNQYKLK